MDSCSTNADCEARFYCDRVLMWCVSCRVICDPKRQMDSECKQQCQEFFDVIHSIEHSTTTNIVPLTSRSQNLLASAESNSQRNRVLLIIGVVTAITVVSICSACLVSKVIVYYKPASLCGRGIIRLQKKVMVCNLCLCHKLQKILGRQTYAQVALNQVPLTVTNASEEFNESSTEDGTYRSGLESGDQSERITEQLTEFKNENETNNEIQERKREDSGVNLCPPQEVLNISHQESLTTGIDQQRIEDVQQPSIPKSHAQNGDDRVVQSNTATELEKKSPHSSNTQSDSNLQNPKQASKSSPNQSDSTVQLSSRSKGNHTDQKTSSSSSKDQPDSNLQKPKQGPKNSSNQSDSTVQLSSRAKGYHTQNNRHESPLAAPAGSPQFDLDMFSTLPKQQTGFSKEFKATTSPISLIDGGADLEQEAEQTPPEGQTAQTQSSNKQEQNKSREHPNKKIYDVLKTLDWVQGYYSEGSSIEVFVNLNQIKKETALKELAMRTRSYPEKFHIMHESGTY